VERIIREAVIKYIMNRYTYEVIYNPEFMSEDERKSI